MNALVLSSLILMCAADEPPAAPKLPLGKDTTFVVGPLDRHGYIDYEAALNAELSKSVTADKNANALLVQVFGPAPEGGDGLPPEYFRWLGIAVLPKDGDYLIGINAYVSGQLGITGDQLTAFYEVQGRVTQRPWEPKDCPPLAEWLKVNEKPLALALEATKRPGYFNPLVSRRKEGEPSNLIGTLLPTVQKCRELATALTARAMLRLKEGKLDEAWADLLACHRLGRLVARGATLIEVLVGNAICQIAHNSTLAYLDHPDLTAARAARGLKDLQELPPQVLLADKIGVSERMMGLDALQNIRRGGGGSEGELAVLFRGGNGTKVVDWGVVMQTMNRHYDKLAEAMRIKDRSTRAKAFAAIDAAFAASKKEYGSEEKIKKLMEGKDAGQILGRVQGDMLMSLLIPAFQKVQQAHDRAEQSSVNLQIAFALALYRKDTGRYPAKLADLAPKCLASVPADLFTGKALVYRPAEKGYLLYSVGVNEKDDGGNTAGEEPPGDDLPVKMPLPPLKKS